MKKPMPRWPDARQALSGILLLCLLLIGGQGAAQAQGTDFVRLRALDATSFPQITLWFDAFVAGQFWQQVTAEDLLAIEDLQPQPIDSLELLKPGVRLVVAVNLGPQLALRDEEGISRLEKVFAVLDDWAARQPAESADLWSLVSPNGAIVAHEPPATWREALAAYQPDPRNAQPDLRALAFALDTALDTPPDPLMQTVILLITPHLEGEALRQLENQQQRALDGDIPLLIWWVDSAAYEQHSGTLALQTLAASTNGRFATFDEATIFAPEEAFLEDRRYVWQVTYRSALQTGGEHGFSLALTLPDGRQLVSNTRNLLLEVQPPNPILITPPAQILRQVPPGAEFSLAALQPTEQALEILVEFPDGHPRSLVRTTLYVDDQIVDENFDPPFEQFTWDLSTYQTSGQHIVRVEVVDELGLSQLTAPWAVTVTVIQPPAGVLGWLTRHRVAFTWGAVGGAGLLAALILAVSWRNTTQRRQKGQSAALPQPTRPLKRPFGSRVRRSAPPSTAMLRPYHGSGRSIPLIGTEITLGADPVKAQIVLDDPSIAPLHARIVREADGLYRLYDADSVAGVWLNYAPVPTVGATLQAGDVIHFGALAYRFWPNQATKAAPPKHRQIADD